MRRLTTASIVTAITVVTAAVFTFLQLHPALLFSDTTPAGGDMGAHVWGPAFMRDHLLTNGRLTGWTPDWYAGFPAYTFYFPLPSLLIVALDLVVPYNVAFKLVTVLGVTTMPISAWFLGRSLRVPFPGPALMGIATVPFLFERFHTIWGGNIPSTLAGEFSFSIALSVALVYLGVVATSLRTGRHRGLAAALLAICALCHLIPTMFAVAATVVLFLMRLQRGRFTLVLASGVVGGLLTGFWLLPFVWRLPYTNDMGWERTFTYLENLFPWLRVENGVAVAGTGHYKLVVALAAAGVLLSLVNRRRGGVTLALLAGVVVAGFRALALFEGPLWNARVLPFWYLLLHLLAAVAVAEVCQIVVRWWRGFDDWVTPLLPGLATVVVVAFVGLPLHNLPGGGVVTRRDGIQGYQWPVWPDPIPQALSVTAGDRSFVSDWAVWNYRGYERKEAHDEYEDLYETMGRIGRTRGCGRAMWEYQPELDRFGTPMALMLLPYWTDGCIGSMEGLFFESSATTPYHFLNQSELSKTPSRAMRDLPYRDLDVNAGIAHLQLLGVRYYMVFSPEAQEQARVHPDLELIAASGPWEVTVGGAQQEVTWEIYDIADAEIVAPLEREPVVVRDLPKGGDGWLDAAVDFYQDESSWDVPLAADGPRDWARADRVRDVRDSERLADVDVSNIRVGDDHLSFAVDRVGVPVLVKASYFPNWKARGARGPWRVTPNLMVVVPTERQVSLRYGYTTPDILGYLSTALGLAGLFLLHRRSRRPFATPARPADWDEGNVWSGPLPATPWPFVLQETDDDGHPYDGHDDDGALLEPLTLPGGAQKDVN